MHGIPAHNLNSFVSGQNNRISMCTEANRAVPVTLGHPCQPTAEQIAFYHYIFFAQT